MTFINIRQYFNRLQIAVLFLLIVPLLLFIGLYLYVSGMPPVRFSKYFIVFPAIAFADWVMMMVMFNKKIKALRLASGLGLKLEKYFWLTVTRFSMISSASLVLAVGFLFSRNDVFSWLFVAGLLLCVFFWPTTSRVSNDLALKGDEREMVYYKRDGL
jgi:hypothetical protein